MRHRITFWILAIAFAVTGWSRGWAAAPQSPCSASLTQRIPSRPADAPGGRDFAQQLRGLSDDEREARIQHELLSGNVPAFLRQFVPVRLHGQDANDQGVDVVVCAAPDYLAIGSDNDFFLMPMRLGTALAMASQFGLTLPTPRVVDAIYAQATARFVPQPLPAGSEMRSTDYYWHHNELIGAQRATLGVAPGALSAGHKKDCVITNRLWSHPDRVAIYGWHHGDSEPIQPLSTVHGWRYADYSHGARLISTQVFVDGIQKSIFEVLQVPRLASILNSDGVIADLAGLMGTLAAR